jgi:hypothetical protein
MTHTPGEWTTDRLDPEGIAIYADHRRIALVNDEIDEVDANAKLIAAAPDLLAALKAALPYLEHSVKFYRYQQAGHEFWPNREEAEGNITEARAAIAKAEGK